MDNITTKIKRLEAIKPRQDWAKTNREVLMMQIKNNVSEETKINHYKVWQSFKLFMPSQMVLRPAGIFLLIISVALTSGVAVSAAQKSLPGDLLYRVKIATEKTQLVLTPETSKKAQLELEFAGRRLEEYAKIVEKNEDINPEKKEKAGATVVEEYRAKMEVVKIHMEKLEEKSGAKEMVAMAKVVEDKTNEYKQVLDRTQKQLSNSEKEQVAEIVDLTNKTGLRALEIIVTNYEGGEVESSNEDITLRMIKEIGVVEASIINIKNAIVEDPSLADTEKTSQTELLDKINVAQEFLVEAKSALEQEEVELAFLKLTKAQDIVTEYTMMIDKNANDMGEININTEGTVVGSEEGVEGAEGVDNGKGEDSLKVDEQTEVSTETGEEKI